MKTFLSATTTALLALGLLGAAIPNAEAGFFASAAEKRQRIDLNARHTIEELLAVDAKAQRLYERAYGYAVFSVTKGALILTGGGGTGVAVHKVSDKHTYMHMGLGGIGLGIGGQAFQLVMLFEDERTFEQFTTAGWHASSSANAVAGRNGANAEASFTNGVAVYQLTDAGLLLQADIAGTRYWRSGRLNSPTADETVRTAAADKPSQGESGRDSRTQSGDSGNRTTVYPLDTSGFDTTPETTAETP